MTPAELKITQILDKMRECISKDRLIFETSGQEERLKNERFLMEYCVTHKDRINMLKSLTYKNCAQMELDQFKSKEKYDPIMYIFKLEKNLEERLTGETKSVEIYIKIQLFKLDGDEDGALTISFHEAEKPLQYMFR